MPQMDLLYEKGFVNIVFIIVFTQNTSYYKVPNNSNTTNSILQKLP